MDLIDLLYGEKIPEDLYGVTFISPPFEIPGVVPGAEEWRTRYIKRGGKVPNYVQAYAYDTGNIIVESYKRFGDVTPESIKKMFPYNGLSGKMSLDVDRDLVTNLGFVKITKDGKREGINIENAQ
jgi:hypothetical protein